MSECRLCLMTKQHAPATVCDACCAAREDRMIKYEMRSTEREAEVARLRVALQQIADGFYEDDGPDAAQTHARYVLSDTHDALRRPLSVVGDKP